MPSSAGLEARNVRGGYGDVNVVDEGDGDGDGYDFGSYMAKVVSQNAYSMHR